MSVGIHIYFVFLIHKINTSVYLRGDNSDFGWKYHDGENNRLHDDSSIMSPNIKISERRYKDVFIAYATIPGKS